VVAGNAVEKTTYVCGLCKQLGHNSRTCPKKVGQPRGDLGLEMLDKRLHEAQSGLAMLQQAESRREPESPDQQRAAARAEVDTCLPTNFEQQSNEVAAGDSLRQKIAQAVPGLEITDDDDVFISDKGVFAVAGRGEVLPERRPAGIAAQTWRILAYKDLLLQQGSVISVANGRQRSSRATAVVIEIVCDAVIDPIHSVRVICWPVDTTHRKVPRTLWFKHLQDIDEIAIADTGKAAQSLMEGREAWHHELRKEPSACSDESDGETNPKLRQKRRIQPTRIAKSLVDGPGKIQTRSSTMQLGATAGSLKARRQGHHRNNDGARGTATKTKKRSSAAMEAEDDVPSEEDETGYRGNRYADVLSQYVAVSHENVRLEAQVENLQNERDDLRRRLDTAEAEVRRLKADARVARDENELRRFF